MRVTDVRCGTRSGRPDRTRTFSVEKACEHQIVTREEGRRKSLAIPADDGVIEIYNVGILRYFPIRSTLTRRLGDSARSNPAPIRGRPGRANPRHGGRRLGRPGSRRPDPSADPARANPGAACAQGFSRPRTRVGCSQCMFEAQEDHHDVQDAKLDRLASPRPGAGDDRAGGLGGRGGSNDVGAGLRHDGLDRDGWDARDRPSASTAWTTGRKGSAPCSSWANSRSPRRPITRPRPTPGRRSPSRTTTSRSRGSAARRPREPLRDGFRLRQAEPAGDSRRPVVPARPVGVGPSIPDLGRDPYPGPQPAAEREPGPDPGDGAVRVVPSPEPSSWVLFLAAAASVGLLRRTGASRQG